MKSLSAEIRYIFIRIIRAPVKLLLVAGFSLLSILALAYLQHVIVSNETEINRLYDEFVVSGAVTSAGAQEFFIHSPGDIVVYRTVDSLLL